jgi:hypothetical protein
MPTSPSPRRVPNNRKTAPPPPAPPRSLWPRLVLIGVLAALAAAIAALPASVIARFLPGGVSADDFSGTVWHGSAGRITANGRAAGALEWHLHPLALLSLHVAADLHWVKGGFVLDGAADLAHHKIAASNIEGGGPIADLRDFGVAAGWRGSANVRVKELSADVTSAGVTPKSAVGVITVADVGAPQLAGGADLGGYALNFANTALAPDGEATATLTDTGGPLGVNATITLSAKTRSGLLSGTVQARADAPAALRNQLESIAQLHARDAQGRIPVDLEFTF